MTQAHTPFSKKLLVIFKDWKERLIQRIREGELDSALSSQGQRLPTKGHARQAVTKTDVSHWVGHRKTRKENRVAIEIK